jgi:hypothetical protein
LPKNRAEYCGKRGLCRGGQRELSALDTIPFSGYTTLFHVYFTFLKETKIMTVIRFAGIGSTNKNGAYPSAGITGKTPANPAERPKSNKMGVLGGG